MLYGILTPMERNLKGLLFFVAVAAFLAFSNPALAQDVSLEDLGIENTGLLPSNPFYFFKEWGRNIRKSLSFGDLRKAEFQLEILNEQAAEIKKLSDIGSQSFEGFERAVANYEYNANLLRERLVALKGSPVVGKLLDLLLDRALKHQEIVNELYNKFKSEEGVESFYESTTKALDSLSNAVAFVPGNLEDAKKFRERFQLAVLKQKGELREFLAAEFIDRFEDKVSKSAKDEVIRLKDNLLLKWSGKLQGMRVSGGNGRTIRSIENIPGGLKQRLNILDEIRDKIGDSDIKNQLSVIRQKLLDKAKEENAISKEEVESLIAQVKDLIQDVENNFPKDPNDKAQVKGFLDRAIFNLESAERFYEEGAYGSAYGQAVAASAAAKNALLKIAVKSSNYLDELKNIKEYYDALLSKALGLELGKENNPKLFAMFSDAENQIARISDLINQGSESLKIGVALRDLKLLLSSIEQIIEDFINISAQKDGSVGAVAETSSASLALVSEVNSALKRELAKDYAVVITNGLFVPSVVKIKRGDRVTWINRDLVDHWIASAPHPTHDGLKGFDSQGDLKPGESYSFTFDLTGVWKYEDHLNPSLVGVVNVE